MDQTVIEAENLPIISVIVAVFNGSKTLQRCLDSIISQSYQSIELIVIDGGSLDGTVELLAKNSDLIAYWESEKDDGIYHAWNKALAKATGEWVCFLGADDYFYANDVISRSIPHLRKAKLKKNYIAYGTVAIMNSKGVCIGLDGSSWEVQREGFFLEMNISHPGMFHHRSLFTRYGLFDQRFRIAGDYDFLLRVLKHNDAVFMPDLITVAFQSDGISNSSSYIPQMLKELKEIRRIHNLRTPSFWRSKARFKMLTLYFLSFVLSDTAITRIREFYKRLAGRE